MLKRTDMRRYQELVSARLFHAVRVLLALDMGLGKTVITATTYSDLRDQGLVGKVLIVAPKRVAQHTWPDEYRNWEHLSHLKVEVLVGTAAQRVKALGREADVYVINRECFAWLCERFRGKLPFDAIIWDESSGLKEGKKKTKSGAVSRFGWLVKVAPMLKRLTLLSGTPASEGIEDLWAQCRVLDGGKALGAYKTHFYHRWFIDLGRDFPIWTLRQGAYDEILSAAAPLMLVLTSQDVLTLPERIEVTVEVDLPKAARATYDLLKKELLATYDGSEIYAASKGILVSKLAQVAGGAFYLDQETDLDESSASGIRPYKVVHDEKIAALRDIAEEGENLLVFYTFRHELERIRAEFPHARVLAEDPKAIEDWNAGRVRMLVAHPASAGHGLNLQHGGRVCVWFSLPWSLELYLQGCKRLHRSGQKGASVSIIHLIGRKTVDAEILKVIGRKMQAAGTVMEFSSRSMVAEVLAAMDQEKSSC